MAKRPALEAARKTFADITGLMEDAALLASEAQAAPGLVAVCQSCDRYPSGQDRLARAFQSRLCLTIVSRRWR